MGGWWRWALVSPDGVAPSRMVGVSASVNLPLHHKDQKFSSGTGSPGWSRKKGRKTVVWWWWAFCIHVNIVYVLRISSQELRLEDYLANRKGPQQCVGTAGFSFGANTVQQAQGSGFGTFAQPNKPAASTFGGMTVAMKLLWWTLKAMLLTRTWKELHSAYHAAFFIFLICYMTASCNCYSSVYNIQIVHSL